MANDDQINARGGLLPVTTPFGNVRLTAYRLTTSATAAVFIGQPMDLDATGRVAPASLAANAPILGPALGFLDLNKAGLPSGMTSLSQAPSLPANTDAIVLVADDPDQYFLLQEDTGGSALAETNIGNNALMVPRASSGNTTTGYSTVELDRSSVAADTSGNVRIIGLYGNMNSDGTDNSWGNYAKVIVKINRHRLAGEILSTNI